MRLAFNPFTVALQPIETCLREAIVADASGVLGTLDGKLRPKICRVKCKVTMALLRRYLKRIYNSTFTYGIETDISM